VSKASDTSARSKKTTRTRYVIGAVSDIPPGSRRIARIAGRSVGVFNVKGEFFAIRNRCPHLGGPLCLGMTTGVTVGRFRDGETPELEWIRDGEIIRCPWHAWEFDMRSGNAVFGHGWRVAVYQTEIEANGEDAIPVEAEAKGLPASLAVPPPLEMYQTSVESGMVIVELVPPVRPGDNTKSQGPLAEA
jgi:nitrite reductase/ring-hydroxylating ferredoxin subunit